MKQSLPSLKVSALSFLFYSLWIAFLMGQSIDAPRILPRLPHDELPTCDAESSRKDYLLAYAYLKDRRELSNDLLNRAEAALETCPTEAQILRERIVQLRSQMN